MFADRFSSLFEDFFNDGLFFNRAMPASDAPAVNIWQGEKGMLVTARLPGVKPEELEISAAGSSLTIAAKRENNALFTRSFNLPMEVDSAKISATLTDGILRLELPVAERALPRRIEVKCECA